VDAHGLYPLRADEYVVAVMPEEIDVSNADQIWEHLLGLLQARSGIVIVDMSATAFCGVAGVHVLVRVHQRARACGRDLLLVTAVPLVRRVFSITGADRIVRIYPDRQSAMNAAALDHAAANVLGIQFLTLPTGGLDGRLPASGCILSEEG
jgi:anti-sigma B factor antagonist